MFFLWLGWAWGLDWITPGLCFCGWDVETGDINEFWKETDGIERCMGTQRLPNITSISIERPPTHEKAARATFFPYGAGRPEQLFSCTGEINFSWKNTMILADLAIGFRCFLDQIWAAVLGKVCRPCVWMCVCLCVVVRHSRLMGCLAGRTRPHDPPARPTLLHNVR